MLTTITTAARSPHQLLRSSGAVRIGELSHTGLRPLAQKSAFGFRRVLAATFALTIVSVAQAQPATLIARWEFDGPTPYLNTMPNANFPGYDLTPGGGVAPVPAPCGGAAAQFHGGHYTVSPPGSGSNPLLDRLDTTATPTSNSFNSGFSVMGWVRPDGYMPLIQHDSSSSPCCQRLGFDCEVNTLVGFGISILLRNTNDRRLQASVDGPGLPANQWTHVAATWDGSTNGNGFAFYINGVSVTWSVVQSSGFTGLNSTAEFPLRIGATQGNAAEFVDAGSGQIDHLSFYSGVITNEEVQADFLTSITIGGGCPADFNCDGVVTSQDFFEFLDHFFNDGGDAMADFNHDGRVTSTDFFEFIAAFFAGC